MAWLVHSAGVPSLSSPRRSQQNLVLWRQICTVLTTNQHLYAFQVRDSSLPMSVMVDLCHQLKQPKCYLQKLQ